MTIETELRAAVARADADSRVLHNIVHGDAQATVETEGGPVKSVAKAIGDVEDAVASAATVVTAALDEAVAARDATIEAHDEVAAQFTAADVRNLALAVAELQAGQFAMIDGIADPFEDDNNIDTGASSNATYVPGGAYYRARNSLTLDSHPGIDATSNWANTTFRQWLAAGSFSIAGPGRISVRLTFEPNTSRVGDDYLSITAASIGQGDPGVGNDYDFSAPHVAVTFGGGQTTFSIPLGRTKVSDVIDFAFDPAKDLIVAFYVPTPVRQDSLHRSEALGVSHHSYYKSNGDDTETEDASGYISLGQRMLGISLIEIFVVPEAMTLQSRAFSADSEPGTARVQMQVEPVDSIAVNSDLLPRSAATAAPRGRRRR